MKRGTNSVELDPRRDPAWRWALAGRENAIGVTDKTARTARQYRRAWEVCRTDADRHLLELRMPTHFAAHALYRSRHERTAVEIRVLAGEPAADIARKTGVPPAVVETFEAVFFDVRTRLEAVDFIYHIVIGAGTDETAAWMALAYEGGPIVVNALLGPGTAAARPRRPEDVPAFLEEATRAAARRQVAAASRNPSDMALRAFVTRAAGPAGDAGPTGDAAWRKQIETHVQAMLNEIPWVSGMDAERPGVIPPAVAALDTLPGDLRGDELLRISAGEEIPGLAEELAVPLPPPRKEKRSALVGDQSAAGAAPSQSQPAQPPGAVSGPDRSKGGRPG